MASSRPGKNVTRGPPCKILSTIAQQLQIRMSAPKLAFAPTAPIHLATQPVGTTQPAGTTQPVVTTRPAGITQPAVTILPEVTTPGTFRDGILFEPPFSRFPFQTRIGLEPDFSVRFAPLTPHIFSPLSPGAPFGRVSAIDFFFRKTLSCGDRSGGLMLV